MTQTQATPKIESAPPAAPLSQEERQKRYEEYRKRSAKSRFEVQGLPGVHYFWAPKDDSSELTRLDMVGYQIVREPNASDVLAGKAQPKIRAAGLRQDGTYVIGDVILTSCTQETYDFAMADNDQRHADLARSAKENFLIEAEKSGVPTFEFSK